MALNPVARYQSPRSCVCGFTVFSPSVNAIFVSLDSVDSSMPEVNTVHHRSYVIGCKLLINLPKSCNKYDKPCDPKQPQILELMAHCMIKLEHYRIIIL